MDLPLHFRQCMLCNEAFKCPKYLPCMHTFCLQCLEKYWNFHSFLCELLPDEHTYSDIEPGLIPQGSDEGVGQSVSSEIPLCAIRSYKTRHNLAECSTSPSIHHPFLKKVGDILIKLYPRTSVGVENTTSPHKTSENRRSRSLPCNIDSDQEKSLLTRCKNGPIRLLKKIIDDHKHSVNCNTDEANNTDFVVFDDTVFDKATFSYEKPRTASNPDCLRTDCNQCSCERRVSGLSWLLREYDKVYDRSLTMIQQRNLYENLYALTSQKENNDQIKETPPAASESKLLQTADVEHRKSRLICTAIDADQIYQNTYKIPSELQHFSDVKERKSISSTNENIPETSHACPACKEQFSLPIPRAVGSLPGNHFSGALSDSLPSPAMCESCFSRAESSCVRCGAYMCDLCQQKHIVNKGSDHVGEVLQPSDNEDCLDNSLSHQSRHCLKHYMRDTYAYCYDCCLWLCKECGEICRQNHNTTEIQEISKRCRSFIESYPGHVEKETVIFIEANHRLDAKVKEQENDKQQAMQKLTMVFKGLSDQVSEAYKSLREDIDREFNTNRDELLRRKKENTEFNASLNMTEQFIRQTCERTASHNIMSLQGAIQKNLEYVQHKQPRVEASQMRVDFRNTDTGKYDLESLFGDIVKTQVEQTKEKPQEQIHDEYHALSELYSFGTDMTTDNSNDTYCNKIEVTRKDSDILVLDSNNRAVKRFQTSTNTLSVELTLPYDILAKDIASLPDDRIAILDQEVIIFNSLGNACGALDVDEHCASISFCSKRGLFVSFPESGLIKLYSENSDSGFVKQIYSCPRRTNQRTGYLAVGKQEDLVTIDNKDQCLHVFSGTGQYLHSFDFRAHRAKCNIVGVACSYASGHLFVADAQNDFVYETDANGTYLRTLTYNRQEEMGPLTDICVDQSDNLVILFGRIVCIFRIPLFVASESVINRHIGEKAGQNFVSEFPTTDSQIIVANTVKEVIDCGSNKNYEPGKLQWDAKELDSDILQEELTSQLPPVAGDSKSIVIDGKMIEDLDDCHTEISSLLEEPLETQEEGDSVSYADVEKVLAETDCFLNSTIQFYPLDTKPSTDNDKNQLQEDLADTRMSESYYKKNTMEQQHRNLTENISKDVGNYKMESSGLEALNKDKLKTIDSTKHIEKFEAVDKQVQLKWDIAVEGRCGTSRSSCDQVDAKSGAELSQISKDVEALNKSTGETCRTKNKEQGMNVFNIVDKFNKKINSEYKISETTPQIEVKQSTNTTKPKIINPDTPERKDLKDTIPKKTINTCPDKNFASDLSTKTMSEIAQQSTTIDQTSSKQVDARREFFNVKPLESNVHSVRDRWKSIQEESEIYCLVNKDRAIQSYLSCKTKSKPATVGSIPSTGLCKDSICPAKDQTIITAKEKVIGNRYLSTKNIPTIGSNERTSKQDRQDLIKYPTAKSSEKLKTTEIDKCILTDTTSAKEKELSRLRNDMKLGKQSIPETNTYSSKSELRLKLENFASKTEKCPSKGSDVAANSVTNDRSASSVHQKKEYCTSTVTPSQGQYERSRFTYISGRQVHDAIHKFTDTMPRSVITTQANVSGQSVEPQSTAQAVYSSEYSLNQGTITASRKSHPKSMTKESSPSSLNQCTQNIQSKCEAKNDSKNMPSKQSATDSLAENIPATKPKQMTERTPAQASTNEKRSKGYHLILGRTGETASGLYGDLSLVKRKEKFLKK